MNSEQECARQSLLTIAVLFLRLGATAFGGPAAHIAIMQNEFVDRRKLLSQEEFLDLLAASNLIPGPTSTELAMHLGHKQAGLPGLIIAGVCFILPAALMVIILASAYVKFGSLPSTQSLLYGLKPVVVAIVFQAIGALKARSWKNKLLQATALLVAVLTFLGLNQIVLLFGAGLSFALHHFLRMEKNEKESSIMLAIASVCLILIIFSLALAACTPASLPYNLPALFSYFLKTGCVVYGSGYVLVAFIRADLVTNYHWISSAQLLDAIAAGQITPGPVFTSATFIGFLLGGVPGALLATVAIFLPAFVLVCVSGTLVRRMRDSALASVFLDGVNAAALALMAVVLFQLAESALRDLTTTVIALLSVVLLLKFRLNPVWLMAAGAAFGLLKGVCSSN